MPKILMKVTTPGSSDGIKINNYVADREYDVNDVLAKAFISMGVAEYVREEKFVRATPDNKMVGSSPNNKVEESVNLFEEASKLIDEVKEPDEKKKVLRVYQLADELGVSSKKILRVAKKLGVFVSAPASGLSEEEAEKIKAAL